MKSLLILITLFLFSCSNDGLKVVQTTEDCEGGTAITTKILGGTDSTPFGDSTNANIVMTRYRCVEPDSVEFYKSFDAEELLKLAQAN